MPKLLCIPFYFASQILWSAPDKPNFQDDILPILEQSCNSCHNPDKTKGGLDLTSMNGVMVGGSSGETAIPEDSANSLLYLLSARMEEPHMPPRGEKIEKSQLAAIKLWIDQGLLPTASGKPMKKKQSSANLSLNLASMGRPKTPPPLPHHLRLEPFVQTDRAFAPSAVASAPWSPLFAIASPKQVLLYHADSLDLLGILPYPEGFIESLSFSRSGKLILASGGKGGKSGIVAAWQVETGERVLTLGNEQDSILTASISPDQSLVAIGGTSKLVKVFDLASGEVLYQIKKHSEWVTQVSFSPDGILLATADRNGGLHVWEAGTGNPFYSLLGHKAEITDLSWRTDGNVLLSSSEDGGIRTWEMINGKSVKTWTAHSGGTLSAHFDEKGQVVSSGRDKTVKLWDENGKGIRTISGFKDIVMETRLSHDGTKVISGDWSGEIKVWNATDGKLVGSLSGNPQTIQARILQARASVEKARKDYNVAQHKLAPLVKAAEEAKDLYNQETSAQKIYEEKVVNSENALNKTRAELETAKKSFLANKAKKDRALSESQAKKKLWEQANADQNSKLKKYQELQAQVISLKKQNDDLGKALESVKQSKTQSPDDPEVSKAVVAAQKSFDGKRKEYEDAGHRSKEAKSIYEKAKQQLVASKKIFDSSIETLDESSKLLAHSQTAQNEWIKQVKEAENQLKMNASSRDQLKAKVTALQATWSKKQTASQGPTKEVESAKNRIARNEADLTFWQAQIINLQRHNEIAKLEDLKIEFESLEDSLEEALSLQNQASSNLEKTSEALRSLPERITQAQQVLDSKKSLLSQKQRESETLQKRKTEKNDFLSQVETLAKKTTSQTQVESQNKTLTQVDSKIKEALSLLKTDLSGFTKGQQAKSQEILIAQTEVKKAEDSLASTLSQRESTPKVLSERKAELDRANNQVASRRKAVDEFRGRLNEQESKTQNLLNQYLAASPKK